MKRALATSLTATTVIGGVVLIAVAAGQPGHTPHRTGRIVAAALPDRACDFDAVADVSSANATARELARTNPAATVTAARLDRAAAVAQARTASSDPAQAAAADAAAVLAPAQWAGVDFSYVAPTRCTWIVTVAATFTPQHRPSGATATTYSSYTLVLDAASGSGEEVVAGPNALNMLTGFVPGQ